jgi:hypothetical protein
MSDHLQALEQRIEWLQWGRNMLKRSHRTNLTDNQHYIDALPVFLHTLEEGDTFFMNKRFGELVDHARKTIPDDIEFDLSWLHAKSGWMWIEEPFDVPKLRGINDTGLLPTVIREPLPGEESVDVTINVGISAIGWFTIPPDAALNANLTVSHALKPGTIEVVCFQDYKYFEGFNAGKTPSGFGCWSHYILQPGDKLIDRIHSFEKICQNQDDGGAYVDGRASDMLHEIRWVYSAFYLMAQRLATSIKREANRATRRRMQKASTKHQTFVRVISLRKLEEARPKQADDGVSAIVDWQWQWSVRGHWRNQWFRKENTHKPVFVEAYIKGPEGKPLKPETLKLFTATR